MRSIKTTFLSIVRPVRLSIVLAGVLFCVLSAGVVEAQKHSGKSEINGRILGGDGKPMSKAFVSLSDGSYIKTLAVAEADQNGNFRITTDKTGLFLLHFNGVNHLTETVVLMIEKPRVVTVNAKLFVPQYNEDLSEGIVSSEKVRPGTPGTNFTKQPNGTYVAEFETKEKSVLYTIGRTLKVRGAIQGTQPGNHKLHESGILIFTEALPVDGKVKIILDPTKLPPPSDAAKVNFGDPQSVDAKLYGIYREMEARVPRQPQQKAAIPTPEEIGKLLARIKNEKETSLRTALWLNYLDLTVPANKGNPATIVRGLDALSPASPLWVLRSDLVDKAVSAANQPNKYRTYVDGTLNTFPEDVKVYTMGTILIGAIQGSQREKAQTYLGRLVKEFPNHPWTKMARFEMDKGKTVIVGKSVPVFTAQSLDDPNVTYSNTNIKAKVYLIDFWATWCAPCIEQMPYLHRAYEKFHDKGFEILSYSLDSNREVVKRFRKGKFPMPWLHAIDPQFKEEKAEIVKQFEFYGLPAAFLVNAEGKILAARLDLEGDNLEKMLAKIFGEPESAKP